MRQNLRLGWLQRIFERQFLFRRNFVDGNRVNVSGADIARRGAQRTLDFADEVGAHHFQAAVPPLLQPLAGEARLDNIGSLGSSAPATGRGFG